MANTTLLQVRTSEEDKKRAAEILNALGTNLSSVVNMLLKQIIITESIPFDVKIGNCAYSPEESLEEVRATLSMEGMDLTDEEVRMLKEYRDMEISGSKLRDKAIREVGE